MRVFRKSRTDDFCSEIEEIFRAKAVFLQL
jgi:hypothetical protein